LRNAETYKITCNGAIESKNLRVFYFSKAQIDKILIFNPAESLRIPQASETSLFTVGRIPGSPTGYLPKPARRRPAPPGLRRFALG
jgi:hypothetical protein